MRDLIREKRQEQADAARAIRAKDFEQGTRLEGDLVIVPSPGFHTPFIEDLERYGFKFSPGILPRWERDTQRPHLGRVWTGEQWVELGDKILNKHWRTA